MEAEVAFEMNATLTNIYGPPPHLSLLNEKSILHFSGETPCFGKACRLTWAGDDRYSVSV